MRVRQQGSRTLRKTILIYCEGETERIYFEQMRILKRSKMVSVKIKNVKRSAIKLAQHAYRDSSYQYFDEVWIVFDKDDLTEKQLEEVNQFCEEKNIRIAYTNEAFELWLLLHFEEVDSSEKYPRAVLNDKMEQHLGVSRYFRHKADESIIAPIALRHEVAIKNCTDMMALRKTESRDNPYCNIHEMIRYIF
ncbi:MULTISPECIES: RloB family protein [Lysinibacillus]|uniref:RloB family protein n=1 Tax=Lysinibacillus TaxID=400634 RepID=UPI00055B7DAF|nr:MULTISPECIES: RloB family protein [Lysinibacillus]KUF33865.1 abortive phage resistance protein [Lysinibacillus sp. F5]MEE3806758.1 RloB family protein [Lysinibacillus fusiformis]WCH48526.1 RloB family protein [Lysinibacillus sp. OF-1]